ncbi:MAG: dCTP deaminase [Sulfolobales archaeon]
MILSDFDLRAYLSSGRLKIDPFSEEIVRENGVDLRLGSNYCMIVESNEAFDILGHDDLSKYYECGESEQFVLKPNKRYLLHTLEYVALPPELMGFVELRSTFARLGLMIPPTIIDGGFEGQITIEVLSTSFPITLRAGVRFLHVVFSKLTTPVSKPYKGKYQCQKGVRLPILKD